MYNAVNTLSPSFLIESSTFLQVTRTIVKFWISLKFGQIQPCTAELAALDRLKKIFYLLEKYSKYFYDMLALWATCFNVPHRCEFSYEKMVCFSETIKKEISQLGMICCFLMKYKI